MRWRLKLPACPWFAQPFVQRKHQSSASLAFVRGIHRWPVISPHKGLITRKMLKFDDVITVITEHAGCKIRTESCKTSSVINDFNLALLFSVRSHPLQRYFADDIVKNIFLKKTPKTFTQISTVLIPANKSTLLQAKAWHLAGAKLYQAQNEPDAFTCHQALMSIRSVNNGHSHPIFE